MVREQQFIVEKMVQYKLKGPRVLILSSLDDAQNCNVLNVYNVALKSRITYGITYHIY